MPTWGRWLPLAISFGGLLGYRPSFVGLRPRGRGVAGDLHGGGGGADGRALLPAALAAGAAFVRGRWCLGVKN